MRPQREKKYSKRIQPLLHKFDKDLFDELDSIKEKMSSSYASQSKPIYWIKSTMLSQWSDIFLLEAFEFHETGVVVGWAVWQYGFTV